MNKNFYISLGVSIPVFFFGYALENSVLAGWASVIFGLLFFYFEVFSTRFSNVDPIGLFSLSMAFTSLANVIGIQSKGTDSENLYYLYADERYLFEASAIQYFGFICIVGGFLVAKRFHWLPNISYELKSPKLLDRLFILNLVLIWLIYQGVIPSFVGAIHSFFINIPLFSAFFLARIGASKKIRKYLYYAIIIVIILTWQAVLYSYLRSEMIKPLLFLLLGYFMGGKNLYVLFSWRFVPVYMFIIIFNNYFAFFGNQRSRIGVGQQRIEAIVSLGQKDLMEARTTGETPISRSTNFNQLSQVARLADQKGFYSGATLSYMAYVFIPRFLWPEKPLIQIGAWFATEIELGWKDEDGRYHNSINMTVPGEFYLNFGFLGVIIGSLTFGFVFGLFWNSVNFWGSDMDVLGNLFGSYLLFLGFFTIGADLQIIVTVTAIYLLFLISNMFFLRNA